MIIRHGSNPNQVALTFDDGPNPAHTLTLLMVLKKHGARATFFMLGKWIKERPEIARVVSTFGHEVGNHGMNHMDFGSIADSAGFQEIHECSNLIFDSTGKRPKLFRPPYGKLTVKTDEFVRSGFMNTVLWSQLSGDWAAKSSSEILSKINLATDKGEIVLLHDGSPYELGADRSATVEAVEILLRENPHKQFVTVSELEI